MTEAERAVAANVGAVNSLRRLVHERDIAARQGCSVLSHLALDVAGSLQGGRQLRFFLCLDALLGRRLLFGGFFRRLFLRFRFKQRRRRARLLAHLVEHLPKRKGAIDEARHGVRAGQAVVDGLLKLGPMSEQRPYRQQTALKNTHAAVVIALFVEHFRALVDHVTQAFVHRPIRRVRLPGIRG